MVLRLTRNRPSAPTRRARHLRPRWPSRRRAGSRGRPHRTPPGPAFRCWALPRARRGLPDRDPRRRRRDHARHRRPPAYARHLPRDSGERHRWHASAADRRHRRPTHSGNGTPRRATSLRMGLMPAAQLSQPNAGRVAEAIHAVCSGRDLASAAAEAGVQPADLTDAMDLYHLAGTVALEDRAGSRWQQFNVRPNGLEQADRILIAQIGPSLDTLVADGAVSGWWYMNKPPGWRIRVFDARPDAVGQTQSARRLMRCPPRAPSRSGIRRSMSRRPRRSGAAAPWRSSTVCSAPTPTGVLAVLRWGNASLGRREISVIFCSAPCCPPLGWACTSAGTCSRGSPRCAPTLRGQPYEPRSLHSFVLSSPYRRRRHQCCLRRSGPPPSPFHGGTPSRKRGSVSARLAPRERCRAACVPSLRTSSSFIGTGSACPP